MLQFLPDAYSCSGTSDAKTDSLRHEGNFLQSNSPLKIDLKTGKIFRMKGFVTIITLSQFKLNQLYSH